MYPIWDWWGAVRIFYRQKNACEAILSEYYQFYLIWLLWEFLMLIVASEKCWKYMNNSFSDIVVAFLVKNTKQIGIVLLMRDYVGVT